MHALRRTHCQLRSFAIMGAHGAWGKSAWGSSALFPEFAIGSGHFGVVAPCAIHPTPFPMCSHEHPKLAHGASRSPHGPRRLVDIRLGYRLPVAWRSVVAGDQPLPFWAVDFLSSIRGSANSCVGEPFICPVSCLPQYRDSNNGKSS